MNGAEHYTEAERLLAEADSIARPYDEGPCEADRCLAAAQAHATLALAAATALPLQRMILTDPIKAWAFAIDGTEPIEEDDDE